MVTVEGKFAIGVEREGKRFMDFVLRQKIIRDSVEAMEELGPTASQSRLDVAVLARQLSIPGIPNEEITTDFVLDMADADMGALDDADAEVKKKQIPSKPESEPAAS